MIWSENIMSRWSRMKRISAKPVEPDGSSSEPKPIDAERRAADTWPPQRRQGEQQMTRSENIVSRWSRMKQESDRPIVPGGSSTEPKPIDAEPGQSNGVTVATSTTGSAASPAFDPASLPPLQSITLGTDIRSFLTSSVPVELTNAALRRAWVTDPAIRDFVGIAENQWDFNDPTAIPGFGPLTAGNDVAGLAALEQTGQACGVTTEGVRELIEREYFDLFVGLGRGELFPYASYYLTGYLYGRPLARIRQTLKQIGLEKTEGQSEPEDHAAVLLEVMAGLASGQIMAPGGTERNIFEAHLKPWIGRFFSDLERVESATFYASVGTLGRIFMEIETEAFSIST